MTKVSHKAENFLKAAFLSSTMLVTGCDIPFERPVSSLALSQPQIPTTAQSPNNAMTSEDQLKILADMMQGIRQMYVDPGKASDNKKILESALKGIVSSLDPHSEYYTAEEWKKMQEDTKSQFVGIGVEVGLTKEKQIEIVSPMDGSPAEASGLQSKDIILEIDGKSARGMSLSDAVGKIRGERNTPVTLKIYRPSMDKPQNITIIRNVIQTPGVKTAVIGNDIGYVQITSFHKDGIAKQFNDAVTAMELRTKGKLSGYVLNLRNNPGGYLADSATIADDLIDSNGFVTYVRGSQKEDNSSCNPRRVGEDYCAKPGDIIKGKPIVVLVNGGSASASEVVSGALQDYKRATILGTQTYGKGSVQSILPLDRSFPQLAGSAVKLTTALYFTPKGRSIQGIGITPDILYKPLDDADTFAYAKESDYSDYIANPNGTTAPATKSVSTCSPKPDPEKEKSLEAIFKNRTGNVDYELLCAVETLRGTPSLTVTKPIMR